jgi:ELWxxDGT repeat protein
MGNLSCHDPAMPYNSTTSSSQALVTPALAPDQLFSLTRFPQSKSIAFIDAGVQDYRSLVTGLSAGTEVVVLDGRMDAVTQITQTLLNRHGIESLQIISHGTNGGLQLGDRWLNAATLPNYVGQLKSWGDALTEDADILLYGCNVAQDATGKAFVNLLAQSTGADVAASNNLTGNAALGGDWDLEFSTGQINQGLTANMSRSAYSSVLDTQATQFTRLNSAGTSLAPSNLVSLKDTVFFTVATPSGTQLWRKYLQGDSFNTQENLISVGANTSVGNLVTVKDTLYFTVQSGGQTNLWQMTADNTNPTGYTGGFRAPEQINGWSPGTPNVSQLTRVNDKLFFVSNNQLWHVQAPDNSIIGAVQNQGSVKPVFNSGDVNNVVSQVFNVAGTLYFSVSNSNLTQLKRAVLIPQYSGTSNILDMETQPLASPPLSNFNNFQMVGTSLYFTANGTQGNELFRIQNGQNSVQSMGDLNPGLANANPTNLTVVNGTLYFIAQDQVGKRLWKIGANDPAPGIISLEPGVSNPKNLITVDSVLYLTIRDGASNDRIIRYNPASSGNPFQPLYMQSAPNANIQIIDSAYADGRIYFTATEGSSTVRKLYTAKHSISDPLYVDALLPSSNAAIPPSIENFRTVNGNVYFSTTEPMGETRIWKSRRTEPYPNPLDSIGQVGFLPSLTLPTSPGSVTSRVLSDWMVVDGKVLLVADQFNQGKEIIAISSQAPIFNLSNNINYQENATPTLIALNSNAPYTLAPGSRITVRIEAGTNASDRFTILPGTNPTNAVTIDGRIIKFQNETVATYTGGTGRDLIITFDPNKKIAPGLVRTILDQIAYSSTSENLSSPNNGSTLKIEIRIQDAEGGAARQTVNLSMIGVNDAPIVGIQKELLIGAPEAGWVIVGPPGAVTGVSTTQIVTTTNLAYQAGLSIKTDVVPTIPTGSTVPPNDPRFTAISLETGSGFVVDFEMELLQESRGVSADRNADGFDDRAGFSLLVVSNDPTKAIELGFFANRIWAQEDGLGQLNPSLSADPSNPDRTLFTQAEGVGFNTRRPVRYSLAVKGENYTLFADGQVVLNGRLRNYSNATIASGPNPYTVNNTIFFGDNTTAASASARVRQVSVIGTPTILETVIDVQSAQVSPNSPTVRVGKLVGFDIDAVSPGFGVYAPPLVNLSFGGNIDNRFMLSGSDLTATRIDFESQTSYNVTVRPSDSYSQSDAQILTIRVANRDDMAMLATPLAQTMIQNGVLTFSTANGNAIQLSDVDQSPNQIEVKLFGLGGQLATTATIPNGVSLASNGSGNNNQITLTGSLSAINTVLNGLTYRPQANYNSTIGSMPTGIRIEMREILPSLSAYATPPRQIDISINPTPPSAWTIAAQADFDRDGKADILWHNEQTGANVIWKMGANGVETPVGLQTVGDLNWQIIGAADFNGDGKTDILWQNKVTGWVNYWQMNDLAWQQSVVLPTVSDLNFKVAAIADFDQDGKADIMWRNQTNGWNVIWKMGATGFQQSIGLTSVPIDWQVAGVADFDGDGKVDIMWRNKVNGANVVWKMNGMAQQQSFVLDTVADTNFQVAGIADFDGDGKVDILWRNKTTGQVSIWKMNGVVKQAAIALPVVSDPDFQISGIKDVDGDGKLDIVWRNKRTSQNVLWKMNDMNVASITGITSV